MNRRVVAAWLDIFPEKSSWCRNEQVCQRSKSVKHPGRSNGLDTALYKNLPVYLDFISATIAAISNVAIILATIHTK